jgi:hypothetical protein
VIVITTGGVMKVTKKGRRHYLTGAPYSARTRLKNAGCNWDPDEGAWWTGRAQLAARLAAELQELSQQPETIPTDAKTIRGRARYKGRTYYLLAERRDGSACKLAFRDGSKAFWSQQGEPVEVLSRYQSPRSIDQLRRFAEERKAEQAGERACPACARHCTKGSGWCSYHHDGCERCGAEGYCP